MLRSEYVLKTVFSRTMIDTSQYGWRIDNSIAVIWDDEDTIKAITDSKGCGCKGAKCDGSTAGCRNCYRMCKPCNHRCVTVRVIVEIHITMEEYVQDVNNRTKVMMIVVLMMQKQLLKHYPL